MLPEKWRFRVDNDAASLVVRRGPVTLSELTERTCFKERMRGSKTRPFSHSRALTKFLKARMSPKRQSLAGSSGVAYPCRGVSSTFQGPGFSLGFGVWGLGFRGLGFRGLGFRV